MSDELAKKHGIDHSLGLYYRADDGDPTYEALGLCKEGEAEEGRVSIAIEN